MAVPKYDEMYRAFLKSLQDGNTHRLNDVKEYVAQVMGVTSEDRKVKLPRAKTAVFDNRIGWASTYLKKAGLVEKPSRGMVRLTQEGMRVLKEENPSIIDNNFLSRYDSFRNFRNRKAADNIDEQVSVSEDTPQDIFDEAYQRINERLADDLLAEIIKQTPDFFENLVVRLLEKMGYGGALPDAGIVTGKSGDEGIDGIIREDKLGFNVIYIQAKRWDLDKVIPRSEIQRFVGALAGQGATKGLLITTAKFSNTALEYANKQHTTKIVLVDGAMLTKLMIEYDLGVTTETVYEIKKMDTDFFSDEDF